MIVNKRQKCIKCGKKGFFSVKFEFNETRFIKFKKNSPSTRLEMILKYTFVRKCISATNFRK